MQWPDTAAVHQPVEFQHDPVIVAGVPRTGVRLLAAILDAHPALASGPDLPVIATMVQQWHEIHTHLAEHHEKNHRVAPGQSRAAFREATLKLFVPRLESTGKQRFVLQSFAAVALLDRFASLFPEARFLFTVRDPRAVVQSLLQCNWRDVKTGEALPYTRDPVAAARFTAHHLASGLPRARALRSEGRLMMVHYERVCTDPAAAMVQVGAFLHEPGPNPFVAPESAALVTLSPDNPHPPLRCGAVDRVSLRTCEPLDHGPITAAIEQLRLTLGYCP
jgi:Sulfotransferase family